MMRAGPDIDEDQRPEVNDGKAVGKDRAVRRLGQIIIHQPEVGRGEEEGDGVVAVPPLHERILHAGVDRVAFPHRHRDFQAVDNVQTATVSAVAM